MTQIAEEDIFQLFTPLGTYHLLQDAFPAPALDDNNHQQCQKDNSCYRVPHPHGDIYPAETRLHTIVDIIDNTFIFHLVEFLVDSFYQLGIITHITIFTSH